MSSVATPYGLRPAFKSGGIAASESKAGTIASAYNTTILEGAPVALAADGTITLAAAGARAVGVFMGVEYTPQTGRPVVDNKWIANTVATNIVCYYTDDPYLTYLIQANGSIQQSDIGSQANWTTATAGSTTTGLSSVALDTATLTNSGNAGLRIIGIPPAPDNAPGDAFTEVLVQISQHQFVADRQAF